MYQDRQYDICRELIQYLLKLDIDYFCISPGSRSTPLTLSLANCKAAQKAIFYDERAAAYHAVGYARATGMPAVLVCTSGTAPANYFPAVMEASNDRLPLIVISADRPFELYDTGANQTVNQQNLYGSHAAAFANIQAFKDSADKEILSAKEAIITSLSENRPIQINVMFQKPLEPSDNFLFDFSFERKSDKIENAQKKIIIEADLLIIGELNYPEYEHIKQILGKCKIPFYADIRSGLRNYESNQNIANFESILENNPTILEHKIAYIGGKLVSKKISDIVLSKPDLDLTVFTFRKQKSELFSKAKAINNISLNDIISISYVSNIDNLEAFKKPHTSDYTFAEGDICRYIYNYAPSGSILFSGNSMSIRNFDSNAGTSSKSLFFAANRGVSGIDGNISSAIGLAAGMKQIASRLICVVGDLTAIHDLNSLSTIKYAGMPVTIVVINNHGGSIFSKLPISKYKEEFSYWKTPHNYNFKGAAEMFGLKYYKAESLASLEEALTETSETAILVEVAAY